MPTEPIPFVNAQNTAAEELAGAIPSAMNVWVDARGTIRRRPGVATYNSGLGVIDTAGIAGIYSTLAGDLFVVSAPDPVAKIYRVNGGSAASISPDYTTSVTGSGRPVFAETEVLLLIAAGADVQKVRLDTFQSSRLGGDPPKASHVIAQNLRLLVNDVDVDRTKVNYSDQSIGTTDFSGHEIWPTSTSAGGGFFTAEARPDPVVAIAENTNEVWVFGQFTLQTFAPDATLVYAPASSIEVGCAAPYSVVKVDDEFCWLDEKRRFVRSDGRGVGVIGGNAIKPELEAMTTVSDCRGGRVLMGDLDALAWTFPSDGRTFVYQQGVGWGQWSSRSGGLWGQWPVLSHHYMASTGQNLVGLVDGRLGKFDFSFLADMQSASEVISAHITTGFLDRGTTAKKKCRQVRLTLRRGEVSPLLEEITGVTAEQGGYLSYRDNLGEWSPPITVGLGRSGDFETTVTLHNLGQYRTRQWRFQFDGFAPLLLVKAEEVFEALEG